MSKKIYISRSNHISDVYTTDLWSTCRTIFKTRGDNIKYWSRTGPYNPIDAIHCDVFILLVENIWDGLHIGKGSYEELVQALNYGKTVFFAYKRKCDNTMQLYQPGVFNVLASSRSLKKYARVHLGSNVTNAVRDSYQEQYVKQLHAMKTAECIPTSTTDVNVTVNVNVKESPARSTRLSQIPGWRKIPVKIR